MGIGMWGDLAAKEAARKVPWGLREMGKREGAWGQREPQEDAKEGAKTRLHVLLPETLPHLDDLVQGPSHIRSPP